MKKKRFWALLLAVVLFFSDTVAGYADMPVNTDEAVEEQVFDDTDVEGLLSDVSEAENADVSENDISENNPTEADISENDVSDNSISLTEELLEEGPYDFEESHGEPVYDSPALLALGEDRFDYVSEDIFSEGKYYYVISELGKEVYKTLEKNLDYFSDPTFTVEISLREKYADLSAGEVTSAFLDGFSAFDYDHPEIFWLCPSNFAITRSVGKESGKNVKMTIKLGTGKSSFYQAPYDSDPGRIDTDKAKLEATVSAIVEEASKEKNFYLKIKTINDALTNLNYYNRYVYNGESSLASKLAWESISALSDQDWMTSSSDRGDKDSPVCEGYSRAFNLICKRMGIKVFQVAGNKHMWNYVMDPWGAWFAVDVTWDDPVRSDEWTNKTTPEDLIARYVLVGSETVINEARFIEKHPVNGGFWQNTSPMPTPTLEKEAYFEIRKVLLYSYNPETDDSSAIAAFDNIENAVTEIKKLSNTNAEYIIFVNSDSIAETNINIPAIASRVYIIGMNNGGSNTVTVSGKINLSANVSMENLDLSANSINAVKELSFKNVTATVNGSFYANVLDMTASKIKTKDCPKINSLIVRGNENEFVYGEAKTDFLLSNRNVVLYKGGEFAGAFDTLNLALAKINSIGDSKGEYKILINREISEEGVETCSIKYNPVFPKAGKAASITISSDIAGMKLEFLDSLSVNSDVTIENLILSAGVSEPKIKTGNGKLTLKGSSLEGEKKWASIEGNSVNGSSGLILDADTNLNVKAIKRVAYVKIGKNSKIVCNDLQAGTLDMDELGELTSYGSASLCNIEAPTGTWNLAVNPSRDENGLITAMSSKNTVTGDFNNLTGSGLHLKAIDTNTRIFIDCKDFSEEALSNGSLKILLGKKLTSGAYREGIYHDILLPNGLQEGNLIKISGSIVYSSVKSYAILSFDEGRGERVADLNEAINSINSLGVKRDYSVELLSDRQILSKNVNKKNIDRLIIKGNGYTFLSTGNINLACNLLLDNSNWQHSGNLTLQNLSEKSGAILSASGSLQLQNIVSEDELTIRNTINASGNKSQITVKGEVTTNKPVLIELFADKEQTDYVSLGMKVDEVIFSPLILTATGKAKAKDFAVSSQMLPGGCIYYTDENFTDIFSDNAYILTKKGNEIKCIYASEIEAVLVSGEVYAGMIPEKGSGRIMGFYSTVSDAFAEIEAIKDQTAAYSVVLMKDSAKTAVTFPVNAEKVIISSKVYGDGSKENPYSVSALNITNDLTVNSNIVLSNVMLSNKRNPALNVKSGSLELNGIVSVVGDSFGKVTLSEGTELRLIQNGLEGAFVFNNGINGNKAAVTVSASDNNLVISGKISTGSLNVNKEAPGEGTVIFKGPVSAIDVNLYEGGLFKSVSTFDTKKLNFYGDANARFDATSSIGDVNTYSGTGTVSANRGPLNNTVLTIKGSIYGKTKLNILSDREWTDFKVGFWNNYYEFTERNKLINLKGYYNRNDLSLSLTKVSLEKRVISEDSGETTLIDYVEKFSEKQVDAKNFAALSDGGLYYLAGEGDSGYTAARNLTLMCDSDLGSADKADEYTGQVLMNFADASKACKQIDTIGDASLDYYIFPDSICNFDVTEDSTNTTKHTLALPSSGKYGEVTIVSPKASGVETRAKSISGKGNVTFRNFGYLFVDGNIDIKGNLRLENTTLATASSASICDVYVDEKSEFTALGESQYDNVKGEVGGIIGTMQAKSHSSDETCLKVKYGWEDSVDLRIYGYEYDLSDVKNDIFIKEIHTGIYRTADGRVLNKSLSDMQVCLNINGEGERYFTSLSETVKFIESLKKSEGVYSIYLLSDNAENGEIFWSLSGKVELMSLPKYAKKVTISTAEGQQRAKLIIRSGSLKTKGPGDIIFDNLDLEIRDAKNVAVPESIVISAGSIAFTENCLINGNANPELKSVSALKGGLSIANKSLLVNGDFIVKELHSEGVCEIKAFGKTQITDLLGSGSIYINRLSTKAAPSKAQSLLSITGELEEGLSLYVIPYEYDTEYKVYSVIDNWSLEEYLITGEKLPANMCKMLTVGNIPSEKIVFVDANHANYKLSGKDIKVCKYKGGAYLTKEAGNISLIGYKEDGNSFYSEDFLSLEMAFSEIERIGDRNCSYTVLLRENVGEGTDDLIPIGYSLPTKAKDLTIVSSDSKKQRSIFTKKDIKLGCNLNLKGVSFVKVNNQLSPTSGIINLDKYCLSLEGVNGRYTYDSLFKGSYTNPGFEIKGSRGSSLKVILEDKNSTFAYINKLTSVSDVSIQSSDLTADPAKLIMNKGVSGVTNLTLEGNINLYTGQSAISVSNFYGNGGEGETVSVWAKDFAVTNLMDMKNTYIKAGNGYVGTGKISLKNVYLRDGLSEINGKQDAKGNSLISISGTVTKASELANDAGLTIGIFYNNSSSKYARWYNGMVICTAQKNGANNLLLRYTDNDRQGMGYEQMGKTLQKSGKYIVIK